MIGRAGRQIWRWWRHARCLALFLGIVAAAEAAVAQAALCRAGDGEWITQVCFTDIPGAPRYGHNVLGDTPEWDEISIRLGPKGREAQEGRSVSDYLQPGHIFEDIAPRVVDLDFDGVPEIVVVQSSFELGARLAVLKLTETGVKITATPYIGRAYRWLAPIGAADLDGDGHMELAYIDRPHLAKTLRIWRYQTGELRELAALKGMSNHRIGDAFISGGIRDCGLGPEIVSADASWAQIKVTSWTNGRFRSRVVADYSDAALQAVIACHND